MISSFLSLIPAGCAVYSILMVEAMACTPEYIQTVEPCSHARSANQEQIFKKIPWKYDQVLECDSPVANPEEGKCGRAPERPKALLCFQGVPKSPEDYFSIFSH